MRNFLAYTLLLLVAGCAIYNPVSKTESCILCSRPLLKTIVINNNAGCPIEIFQNADRVLILPAKGVGRINLPPPYMDDRSQSFVLIAKGVCTSSTYTTSVGRYNLHTELWNIWSGG